MRARTIICLIIPVVAAGCALVSIPNPIISGSLVIHDPDGSQEVWTADRCLSGDRSNFVGWDFSSSSNASQLRALVDPIKGPVGRWRSGPPARRRPAWREPGLSIAQLPAVCLNFPTHALRFNLEVDVMGDVA
jgi:hypothetical protein